MTQGPMLRISEFPAESRAREKRGLVLVRPMAEPIESNPVDKRRLGFDLVEVSRQGFLEQVKKCLEKGADVDARDLNGRTALMRASFNGHTDVVEFLLEKHSDINAKDSGGWTALMYASFSFHADAMERLILKGADVNAFDNEFNTAMGIVSRLTLTNSKEMQLRACEILKRNCAVDYKRGESADLV